MRVWGLIGAVVFPGEREEEKVNKYVQWCLTASKLCREGSKKTSNDNSRIDRFYPGGSRSCGSWGTRGSGIIGRWAAGDLNQDYKEHEVIDTDKI